MKKSVWSVATVAFFVLGGYDTRAQTDERKFEVGGQFSLLRVNSVTATVTTLPCAGPLPCPTVTTFAENRETEPGFGGRIAYNFTRYVAFEAEGDFFPRDRDFEGGHKTEGLFGVKVGSRGDRFGLFAKARPGFIRYAKGDYRLTSAACIAIFPPSIGCFEPIARTNFAFDVGGVAEYYPSKRTIVRFDAGDTIIRFGQRNVAASQLPPGGTLPIRLVVIPAPADTTHNFQASVGFGFRF